MVIHGFIMAIFCTRPNSRGNGGLWFDIHRTFNSIAILGTIAGFGIALHTLANDERKEKDDDNKVEHFDFSHAVIGPIILCYQGYNQWVDTFVHTCLPKKHMRTNQKHIGMKKTVGTQLHQMNYR
jgi:hypothetical protein